jgi:hypothetical protein
MGNGALALGPKLPRPSSTLPSRLRLTVGFRTVAAKRRGRGDAIDPLRTKSVRAVRARGNRQYVCTVIIRLAPTGSNL